MNSRVDVYCLIYNNKSEKCLGIIPALDYPKDQIRVTVLSDRKIDHKYKHVEMNEKEAYEYIKKESDSDYIWLIYGDYIIQSTSILKDLIKRDLPISSGMLTETNSYLSNFWGALSETGWYARSGNYTDIVDRNIKGSFEVPYVTGNILFKSKVFKRQENLTQTYDESWDLDMNICHNLRTHGEKMFIVNDEIYGYIDDSNTSVSLDELGPWKDGSYLDPKFAAFMDAFTKSATPFETDMFKELGPDIWQFPIFKPEFCDYLIQLAEKKNEWSAGVYAKKNEIDHRIGGIENYPTQDIHLTQLGLHHWWQTKVVGTYFKSVLSHLYKFRTSGYNIAFIVKYTPDGQSKLDPHHDASAYTTNIALNTYGSDYTGGGCNFLHKKIECIGNLKGHVIMHPGRITHYHEAYPVQTGTRYILVSFNN